MLSGEEVYFGAYEVQPTSDPSINSEPKIRADVGIMGSSCLGSPKKSSRLCQVKPNDWDRISLAEPCLSGRAGCVGDSLERAYLLCRYSPQRTETLQKRIFPVGPAWVGPGWCPCVALVQRAFLGG